MRVARDDPENVKAQERLAASPQMKHPFYWDAFQELSTERQLGAMGYGFIPVSKIVEYARSPELELTEEEQLAFKFIIRSLDSAYIELQTDKAETTQRDRQKAR